MRHSLSLKPHQTQFYKGGKGGCVTFGVKQGLQAIMKREGSQLGWIFLSRVHRRLSEMVGEAWTNSLEIALRVSVGQNTEMNFGYRTNNVSV